MASPPAASLETTAIVLAIFVLFIARRTYRTLHGARYAPPLMFAFIGYAVAFFALFAATTLYAALGTWGPLAWLLLAPYVATAALVAVVTYPHVRAVVRFERRADGQAYYSLPWVVPVLYLVLYTVRLVVEVVVFGLSSLTSPSFPSSLPETILLVAIAFDLLYAVSVGLLFGRAFGVRAAYGPWARTTAAPSRAPAQPLL